MPKIIPQITSHDLHAVGMGRVAFKMIGGVNIRIGLSKKIVGIHDHEKHLK